MPRTGSSTRRDRGVVIVWLALFLLLMLGFIAVGVDLAKLMTAKTQLQNAADASALAGASSIDFATGHIRADSALVRAQALGVANGAFVDGITPVVVDAADVIVDVDSNTVKVTTRRQGDNSVVTYFAKVLNIHSLEMTA